MMIDGSGKNDDGFTLSSSKKKKRSNVIRDRHLQINHSKQQPQIATKGFGKWAKPTTNFETSIMILESAESPLDKNIAGNEEFTVSQSESHLNASRNGDSSDELYDNAVDEQQFETGILSSIANPSSSLLSSLMEEYGSYDPNWMNVDPIVPIPLSTTITATTTMSTTSMLPKSDVKNDTGPNNTVYSKQQQQQQQEQEQIYHEVQHIQHQNKLQMIGHAPIHIEFVSFGYKYGIPSELRNKSATGNSFSQPLVPFDVRHILEPIPQYLFHLDGKSGIVKSTLLKWNPELSSKQSKTKASFHEDYNSVGTYMNVRDYINNSILASVKEAIIDAIEIGQHGYVSPLTMNIFIGSEYGKHRSVVTCELIATSLRQIIRTGYIRISATKTFALPCTISIGCKHRDIQQQQNNSKKGLSKKQQAFDDE